MPLARLPAAIVTNNASGVTLSGSFSGTGAGLTNFSSNVALLDRDVQVFSGDTNAFGMVVKVGTRALADSQLVNLRVLGDNSANWKGGAAFGHSNAAVIVGELSGVATIGGHTATLNAWTNLSLNPAGGNVGIGNPNPTNRLMVVNARCDGSSWINASDRNLKQGFAPVDAQAVLEKVAALPVTTWSYTAQPGEKHLGPVAQDFRAAFGLGADDVSVATVDADGVALAAIQGLNQKLEEKNAALAKQVAELKALVETLARKVNGGGQ